VRTIFEKRPIKENEAPAEAQNLLRSSTEPYKTHQEKPEAERAAHKATEKARLKKSCRERTNAGCTRDTTRKAKFKYI